MLKQFQIPDGDVVRVDSISLRKVVKEIFINCGVSEIESEISELDEIISKAHDFKAKERDCDRRIDEVSSSIEQLKEFE